MRSLLLVRDFPRALALQPSDISVNSAVLIFEHKSYDRLRPQCNVTLVKDSDFDVNSYRRLNPKQVYGCLGLLQVENDMFLAVVTSCMHIGEIRLGESVHRILDVEFYSLTSNSHDSSNRIYDEEGSLSPQSEQQSQGYVHPCAALKKLLSNGHFYFSSDFDLTRTLSARVTMTSADKYSFDDHFLWNKYMIKELLNFRSKLSEANQELMDKCGFLVLAIQGYIGRKEATIESKPVSLSVISKLSYKRAGTRYNTRGIDDDGNVANFVETETILQLPTACFSYVQVRGSVPVFWEQQGLQVMSHKIQISRGPAATQPAVERHFNELQSRYGEVDVTNLLGCKEGESILGKEYSDRIFDLNGDDNRVHMINFDFNTICKGGNYDNVILLINEIQDRLLSFDFFLLDMEMDTPVNYQRGVFRTNCVDCLDRTNVVQSVISKTVLELYLRQTVTDMGYDIEIFFTRHSYLWAENADSLSKIYAGTGALKSEFTRSGKFTWSGVLGDAQKTMNRFYINNFQDKNKQEIIDLLLGKLMDQRVIEIHDPVQELVLEDLQKRKDDFSMKYTISVFVGSMNLNGCLPSEEPLSPWLFAFDNYKSDLDLFVIGFQEIVELVPQQIISADPGKLRTWEKEISYALNNRSNKNYVILRSGQLVGTALVIYAKADIVSSIRNVEYVMKKTGYGGMTGNKGAVAIRLDYHDTSMCFVTAHFAAGHANWEERNRDYKTINDGLLFKNGRRLEHHEYVVWLGDFNYRISLNNDEVRSCIEDDDLDTLLRADQLSRQIEWGYAFNEYIEGPIDFLPTYKYDSGTDDYDTSEKARVPAWTDRILYRGDKIRQIGYSRAELRLSDHRPVMSLFDIEVIKCDEAVKEKIQRDLYLEKLKLVSQGNVNSINTTLGDEGKWDKLAKNVRKVNNPLLANRHNGRVTNSNDKAEPAVGVLIDFEDNGASKEEDLPPPSSETYQWWMDDSASSSSKSTLVVDKNNINKEFRNISSNPFHEDSIVQKTAPLLQKPNNSLSSNILTPIKTDKNKNNNHSISQKPVFKNKLNPFSEDDDSFLSSAPNFDDKSSSNSK